MLYALTSSASALVNVVTNALLLEYVASIGEGICPAKDPRLRIKPDFLDAEKTTVSPSREEQEKCNLPFNHARENRVGHADHGIHVNSHDVLVFLFSGVDEVRRHHVRLAHIVDYKCIRLTPMETFHLEYIPKTPMSKLRRSVLSSRRVSGSFFAKSIRYILLSTFPAVRLASHGWIKYEKYVQCEMDPEHSYQSHLRHWITWLGYGQQEEC